MTVTRTQIVIAGGGVAGLTAAAAFGAQGFEVLLVDPAPPVTDADAKGADLRTTAFLQPAQALLARAGLWDRLAPHAAALQVMEIMDLAETEAAPRAFDAQEISDAPFGWNFPNWLLRRELMAALSSMPNVGLMLGQRARSLLTREREARVTLDDGTVLVAQLLIAADGRASPMRRALDIPVQTWRYGQKALAFAVSHEAPHHNISTEIHQSGGPFTLVPLPDRDGKPASAVVWMETGAEAERLSKLPEAAFNALMTERSGHRLGQLILTSPRSLWPIISQIARMFSGERTALIAEAAHVVPPIGAQGLNTSLGDIARLLELAEKNRADLGDQVMLDRYHQARYPEVLARVTGVDALNRASMATAPPLQALRAEATRILHGTTPLRQTAMRLGLG